MQEALIAAARAARAQAYAPYSGFAVGAAVLDEQGRIHAGCNVENAAFPQGWCAETSALAALVWPAQHMAVAVCGDAAEPVTPCGGAAELSESRPDDCRCDRRPEHRDRGLHDRHCAASSGAIWPQ